MISSGRNTINTKKINTINLQVLKNLRKHQSSQILYAIKLLNAFGGKFLSRKMKNSLFPVKLPVFLYPESQRTKLPVYRRNIFSKQFLYQFNRLLPLLGS